MSRHRLKGGAGAGGSPVPKGGKGRSAGAAAKEPAGWNEWHRGTRL